MLSAQVWENRESIYQAALRIERTDQEIHDESLVNRDGNKRRASTQSGGQSNFTHSRRRLTGSSNQGPTYSQGGSTGSAPTQRTYPICDQCGRQHSGECKLHLGACFGCRELGHIVRNCPTVGEQTVMGGRAQTENQVGSQSSRGYNRNNNSGGRYHNNNNHHVQSQASQVGGQPRIFAMHGEKSNASRGKDTSKNL
ncbi:hypothetical protein LINPERPRIM_LOCUS24909 [Linum perenne]